MVQYGSIGMILEYSWKIWTYADKARIIYGHFMNTDGLIRRAMNNMGFKRVTTYSMGPSGSLDMEVRSYQMFGHILWGCPLT